MLGFIQRRAEGRARHMAEARLRDANALFARAYQANRRAEAAQDTRRMHETRAALYRAQNNRLAAEVALAGLGQCRRPSRMWGTA